MLDIQFIRDHADRIKQTAVQKKLNVPVDELIEVDQKRRELIQKIEGYRTERNQQTKAIGELAREKKKEEMDAKKEEVRLLNQSIKELETEYQEVETSYLHIMNLIPNVVSEDTPVGNSDEDNVELEKVGEIPQFSFTPKDHMELGQAHEMFDVERGVKISGTRNYVLKNQGLFLHRAVQQLAVDLLHERGFSIMDVPLMANEEVLYSTGFFPDGKEQTYHLEKDNKYLVGTAEVPLVGFYGNEIVDVEEPIRLGAVSNCFRREAGSAGRDVRGLYRVHQFAKVEQVVLCKNDPELADRLLSEITEIAKEILNLLELPYRVVAVCTGDMSQKNHKQYDIETWMPSRESYSETHSSSNVTDFQARRSNIRYRDENGKLQYCYTLNNTAVATPRILIPLLENHQQEDGSIAIPKALQKYMYGKTTIQL
ncbi:serine--tRNA ligase [Shouchella miscanthi]|uniref:Serine--tRNA ligase n=1 Tax=Shouchella miscanthi TaxID=2598861 RepID=A0ABU6NHJ9_9BACI|nr:serine--tRNA ligase [Shouchella miscanthi]MED4127679.1 serine--tRNA ligase [Shouchella miscanthi]